MAEGSLDAPKIERFESVAAFMDAFRASGATIANKPDWTGETAAQIRASLANGNTDAVPKAEAVLDKINARLDLSGIAPRWGRSVVGAFPDVPAFLAGAPESMIRREPGESPRGAISVYYSPVAAAKTSHETWHANGITVLAAIMALSRVRPVNAYCFTPYGIGDHVIRLRTDPMVLSESAYILTSPGFFRAVSYEYAATFGWGGGWGNWSCSKTGGSSAGGWSRERKTAHMKKILGMGEDDILIPALDPAAMAEISDPVTWINGLLDKYRG